ncbi:MAG TPA: hypothetical protein VGQ13_03340 [Nitrososphaera sp.]|nr:hypothetical protein [Nitrososphaera sp.]
MNDGLPERGIIDLFQGDRQLVEIWKAFLIHNRWMEHPDGKWIITDKGRVDHET